jgi:hypothetical protein
MDSQEGVNISWLRRRWFDFRQGHGMYLIFAMTFTNFVLIFYRLLVEEVEFLGDLFANLWVFVVIFLGGYIPVAILIGNWHRKTQMKVEHEQAMKQNPLLAKNFRVILDLLEGKASKDEVDNLRKFLRDIENGKD